MPKKKTVYGWCGRSDLDRVEMRCECVLSSCTASGPAAADAGELTTPVQLARAKGADVLRHFVCKELAVEAAGTTLFIQALVNDPLFTWRHGGPSLSALLPDSLQFIFGRSAT
jgi:hypothetical protein